MLSVHQPAPVDLAPASWALSDDQHGLCAAARRFAIERLEPLLTRPPEAAAWNETVRLAAALELGRMILPERTGGMAISRHDLALVIEQCAAGPIERATELTLSSAALMTLRECDVLDLLPARDVRDYFDGTTSISLGIPAADDSGLWLLRQHSASPALTILADGKHPRLALASLPPDCNDCPSIRVAAFGALTLERHRVRPVMQTALLVMPRNAGPQSVDPVQRWLAASALYLAALLSGAIRHSVNFAVDYSVSRQTFRKPLINHQLVAARLADMLMASHCVPLFLRSVAAQETWVPVAAVRQLARHVATEAMDVSRELVQLCGGHGYVEGLPPAARFQTMHWFAMLLIQIDAALGAHSSRSPAGKPEGAIS